MTGLLLVDKPEGITSAGVIRALKGRLGRTKVGHLGTLDPFASGLLPLCLGEATKIARYLLLEEKAYTGTIQLGTATDTLDRTGGVVDTAAVPALTAAAVEAVAARFTGEQTQVPPMYSALKRDGVPLYKLARQGIEIEREPRAIRILTLRLAIRDDAALDFVVTCTKGTYVRVLAADIARALGTVGHLTTLRRTAVGAFQVESATGMDALAAGDEPLALVGVRDALASLRGFTVDAETLRRLAQGQQHALGRLPPPEQADEAGVLVDESGAVNALVEAAGPVWRLVRMLRAEE